ncbi:hypothetical protein PITC_049660 [Penicillium italicum]|uniref:Uncharacterized protein n=1 Tax=Penicillium italicum TaxID=40296 RepID=A0A0A2K6W9_PENIT|nr:hypothetical protein PITC_049660 [Penicillium italicum]
MLRGCTVPSLPGLRVDSGISVLSTASRFW